jgi:hypothetical protein
MDMDVDMDTDIHVDTDILDIGMEWTNEKT